MRSIFEHSGNCYLMVNEPLVGGGETKLWCVCVCRDGAGDFSWWGGGGDEQFSASEGAASPALPTSPQ